MHINYVMWGMGRSGGTVTFTEIGKRLMKKGHRVTVTSLKSGHHIKTKNGLRPSWWDDDIQIEYIPVNIGSRYRRFIAKKLLPLMNLPVKLTQHWNAIYRLADQMPDCDINVASYFMTAFPVYLSQKGSARFYHMQHYEPLFITKPSPENLIEKKMAELSYILPLNRIANCSWLQKTVKEKHSVESTLINHAVLHEFFHPRPNIKKPGKKRILCLGKIGVDWKGISTLTEALKIMSKSYADFELTLYGAARKSDIGYPHRYIFNPTFEELGELYCSSDIMVCPSWYESFPAPPLEGMASGVPVVTTSIGVEDYAVNEKNCLVVPPRDPQLMADAILRLLTNQDLCKRLSEEGPKTAQQFTWDKTTDKVEKLFQDALSKPSPPPPH